MTYRLSLILGLVIALPSAMLPAARGSNGVSQPAAINFANSPGQQNSSWKASDQEVSNDIKFKRPDGIVFTDQPEEPKKKPATTAAITKPATAPATIAAPAAATASLQGPALSSAFATIEAPSRAPIQLTPATATASTATVPAATTTAAAAIAPATTLPTAPAAAQSTPIAAATAPAATSAATPASNSTVHTDDQIQLVARLLMDQGVIRAADEEPLPAAPSNGMNNGHVKRGNNGTGPVDPATGECCYDDCNSCNNCCQPCLFWTGGVEATFLSPDLNRQNASFQIEDITPDGTTVFNTETLDTDSLYVSPRVWLGVQGACWGANLRYWHLQASEGTYDPSLGSLNTWDSYDCGVPDVGFFTCSRLEAYTVDLEITRRFCLHDCWMQASMGVRHAELWDNESITGVGVTEAGLLNGFGRANRNSRGTGILLGLYGRKPIFPCSCVNWFYNARWSALWGQTQTAAETFAAVQAADSQFTASAASINGAYTTIDDTMFIGEIQLGLEWDYCLCCLPANAFFRIALEYQRWDGGAGESAANSFAGIEIQQTVDPASIVSTNAFSDGPQMDLFGFTIGTGLTW